MKMSRERNRNLPQSSSLESCVTQQWPRLSSKEVGFLDPLSFERRKEDLSSMGLGDGTALSFAGL